MSADDYPKRTTSPDVKLRRSISHGTPGSPPAMMDKNNNPSSLAEHDRNAMQLVKADSLMGLLRLPNTPTTTSSSSELALPRRRDGLSEVKIKHQFFTLSLLELVCNLLNSNNAKFADMQFKGKSRRLFLLQSNDKMAVLFVFRQILFPRALCSVWVCALLSQ